MNHSKLIGQIEDYARRYPHEDVTRFRDFVHRQPHCFERDCFDDGHVTGSALVLNLAGTAMLMTHHAKLGKWLQLGGHSDGNPDTLQVAMREAEEESGLAVIPVTREILDLDIHAIPAHRADPVHHHYDVRYLLRVRESDAFSSSQESLELRWVSLDAVVSVTTEESILRMVTKCRG